MSNSQKINWVDRDPGQKFSIVMGYLLFGAILAVATWSYIEKAIEGEQLAIAILALMAAVGLKTVIAKVWCRAR